MPFILWALPSALTLRQQLLLSRSICGSFSLLVPLMASVHIRSKRTRQRSYTNKKVVFLLLPPVLASLPVFNRVLEEDKSLRNLQAQWGMVGLALTHAINHLEAVISPVMISTDTDQPGSSLKDELDSLVAMPLAHALRLVGANFNELSTKRCCRSIKGIHDPHLVKWLEDFICSPGTFLQPLTPY